MKIISSLCKSLLVCSMCVFLSNCGNPFCEIDPPPVECSWERTTDYCFFSTYLRVPSECAYFDVDELNAPLIYLSQMFDAAEQYGKDSELVWQSVGNTCTENTMNGPKLVITDAGDLADDGCGGFIWHITSDVGASYIEHELTLKIEDVRNDNTGQYGTILWHKLFCQTEFGSHTANLDCIGQFLPYDGDRQIYVCNAFVNF